MKTKQINPSFCGIKINGTNNPLHCTFFNELKGFENSTSDMDVFVRSVRKSFPYRNSSLSISAIKLSARPKNLSFLDRLLNRKTVTDYFPTGNMGEAIRGKLTFAEFFKRVISRVKK